jgi:hypothetical protein
MGHTAPAGLRDHWGPRSGWSPTLDATYTARYAVSTGVSNTSTAKVNCYADSYADSIHSKQTRSLRETCAERHVAYQLYSPPQNKNKCNYAYLHDTVGRAHQQAGILHRIGVHLRDQADAAKARHGGRRGGDREGLHHSVHPEVEHAHLQVRRVLSGVQTGIRSYAGAKFRSIHHAYRKQREHTKFTLCKTEMY